MQIPLWYRIASRVRGLTAVLGPAIVLIAVIVGLTGAGGPLAPSLATVGIVLVVLALALSLAPYKPVIAPGTAASPIRGPWLPLNSPDAKVPSHGTHSNGQTFAIDLVYDPGAVRRVGSGSAEKPRPAFGEGKGFRPPTDFPAYGQAIYAPAFGQVVAVRDSARDHLSRSNWLAFGYLLIEGSLRELAGSRFLLGNHVVVDVGGGCFAVLAHLKRGSVAVKPGDRIEEGQRLAECGNSGNTTEPHVHFQLMDSRYPAIAAGVPFAFAFTGIRAASTTTAQHGA